MTKSTITVERITSVIERLEHYACNLKWTNVRGAQDLLTAADGLRELQERRKADSEPVGYFGRFDPDDEDLIDQCSKNVKGAFPLYRHAQPAPAFPVCTCPSGDGSLRWPCPVHAGSSPVIPDGYVLVPMRLTAENGAKGALSGEFSETKFVNCPECFGDDECKTCDGSGKIEITVPVTWTTIKAIWVKGVEHFAVTAQEND
ncbi:hypothetical protein [Klebsiella variicola]|uniref:hypothetical protein n=1 Tax=Klebsiella variicola TaxID=244366 RepID=UPI002B05EF04|nr:hypothetical protein [Klebsiella variicola]